MDDRPEGSGVVVRYLGFLALEAGRGEETVLLGGSPRLSRVLAALLSGRPEGFRRLILDSGGRPQPFLLVVLDGRSVDDGEDPKVPDGSVVELTLSVSGG